MQRRLSFLLVLSTLIALVALALPAAAQDGTLPEPETVTVEASDGLALAGSFYPAPESANPAPAVLLMHMFNGRRADWEPLVPALHEAGFAVLAVDLRGHGDTGGSRNWLLAQDDITVWLAWLREQPALNPDAIALGGASIGSNLALTGMAADRNVLAAFALSPGLDYFGVTTSDALDTIGKRPVMLVAGHSDMESARAVRALTPLAEGDLLTRLYPTHTHGTTLFREPRAGDLPALIATWLSFTLQASNA